MDQINSLGVLATNAGAIIVVTLIVQFTKTLIPKTLNTRLYVLLLSLLVLLAGTAAMNPTVEGFGLILVNMWIVAISCMGAYDLTFKSADVAKKLE